MESMQYSADDGVNMINELRDGHIEPSHTECKVRKTISCDIKACEAV